MLLTPSGNWTQKYRCSPPGSSLPTIYSLIDDPKAISVAGSSHSSVLGSGVSVGSVSVAVEPGAAVTVGAVSCSATVVVAAPSPQEASSSAVKAATRRRDRPTRFVVGGSFL